MNMREIWLTNAKAKAKEVWREQNRELARKRTEALERQQAARQPPNPPENGTA